MLEVVAAGDHHAGARLGNVEPHLQSFAPVAGDVLLLCSDGLHEAVTAEALAATLQRSDDPAQVCAELVAMAVSAHSSDNISALVARIERGASLSGRQRSSGLEVSGHVGGRPG